MVLASQTTRYIDLPALFEKLQRTTTQFVVLRLVASFVEFSVSATLFFYPSGCTFYVDIGSEVDVDIGWYPHLHPLLLLKSSFLGQASLSRQCIQKAKKQIKLKTFIDGPGKRPGVKRCLVMGLTGDVETLAVSQAPGNVLVIRLHSTRLQRPRPSKVPPATALESTQLELSV